MPSPRSDEFTPAGVTRLLTAYLDAGYTFHDFGVPIPSTGAILLRHDIDLDLDDAVTVARIEADLGIRAHYFVMMTSPMYNVASRRGRAALQEIADLGHAVGVHMDPAAYADSIASPQEALTTHLAGEAEALESITSSPVTAYSLHRPSDWDTDYPGDCSGLAGAYDPRCFRDIAYSSDSEGWWRYGAFTDSAAFAERRSVQLLLHPEWWTGRRGETPGARMDRLVTDRGQRTQADVVATINPYGPYLRGCDAADGGWPDASVTRPAQD